MAASMKAQAGGAAPAAAGPAAPDAEVYSFPASFQQKRLWLLHQLHPRSPAYNIPAAFRIEGPLDADALDRTLQEVVRRHESLRTSFAVSGGELHQLIAPSQGFSLAREAADEAGARRRIDEEVRRPFSLGESPLFRALLLRLGPEDHVLLLDVHHAVADGWSLGILSREIEALYGAFRAGLPPPLPDLPIQYADFSEWQQKWLRGGELDEQLAYWRRKLGGEVQALELPADRPRPAAQTFRGDWTLVAVPEATVQALKALSRKAGATLFMTMLAAFKVLLQRYSAREDVWVGSPVANRARPELEGVIGFFVNTLVLRTDLSGDPSFLELLERVRATSLEAQAHLECPFEKVVEAVDPRRDPARNPLFQVFFSLQDPPMVLRLPPLVAAPIPVRNGTAKFDLFLELWEAGGGVEGRIERSADLFDEPTILRIWGHYARLLEGIAADPSRPISRLPLLGSEERRAVLESLDATRREGPEAAPRPCAGELLEAQAVRTPAAAALRSGGREMTYAELDARAGRIAGLLREMGAGRDSRVGLFLERGMDLIAGLCGILRSGAAYVPLDPAYPAERTRWILEDAGAGVILTQRSLLDRLPRGAGRAVCLDAEGDTIAPRGGGAAPAMRPALEDLAYVLYTSGSTGRPKGVAMPHGPLANLLEWQASTSRAGPGTRTLGFTSVCFDVSSQEILSTLATGGTLVLISEEERRDPRELLRVLQEERIERLFLPFVALKGIAEAAVESGRFPGALREVITAGEQLVVTPALVELFRRTPGARLFNHYGPTESHVATSHELRGPPESWPALPPIGRTIANARAYVLDRGLEPVPPGVPGELYLGGACLARGYHGRPDLTAERFLPDPFAPEPGARMYRTGDLARALPSGDLEFLGRADDQVKVRGYRVEPGEIEAALLQHPGVAAAAVASRPDARGEPRLVGYVVAKPGARPSARDLREHVGRSLPEHMVPSAFVALEKLPLSPSGKVSRRELPPPGAVLEDGARPGTVGPRDEVEARLAALWSDVLGREVKGVRDGFFELGGHSLLAVKLIDRIERAFSVRLPIALLFQGGTIEKLASALRGGELEDEEEVIVPVKETGSRRPLFLVHSVGGDVLFCRALGKLAHPEQPLYGIQAPLAKGLPAFAGDIRAMAERYVKRLRRLQPEGPYFLGGWSSGGMVALEMAQRLLAAGEEVALLAVIDTAPWSTGDGSVAARLRGLWSILANVPFWIRHDLLESRPAEVLGRLGRHLQLRWRRLRSLLAGRREGVHRVADVVDLEQIPKANHEFMELHYRAYREYRPDFYPGRVTLFKARASPLFFTGSSPKLWHRLAREVAVRRIPGNHLSMLREPRVRLFAEALEASLAEAQGAR